MLSYALAIAVGLSSSILFFTAFLMSDIHRQDDFFWSGIGFFYALVLWFCATRITGGLLLGQTAAVALLISYNWQTLKLRKAIAHPERAEELNKFSVLAAINGLFARGKSKPQPTIDKSVPPTVTEEKITIPETPSTDVQLESTVATKETPAVKVETPEIQTAVSEISTPANQVANKPGLFGKFFGDKKQKSSSNRKPILLLLPILNLTSFWMKSPIPKPNNLKYLRQ
jgi:Ycf66 protein N-terminus